MRSIWLIWGVVFCLHANAETRKTEYRKSFPKEGIVEVMLSSRNGSIEVAQTAKDSIYIAGVVSVTAKNQNKADELSDFIRIDEKRSGKYVNVTTVFDKDLTLNQLFSGVEVDVSYKVNLPQGVKLRVIHAEGNLFVDDFAGDVNLDMKSCDVKVGKLTDGELLVKQVEGQFSADDAQRVNGEFHSCTVRVGAAKTARLTMKDCDGRIESADALELTTEGGSMKFGRVGDMSGASSSTKYEVQDIGNSLRMDMYMGEINVRNVHFTFSLVEITASFSKVGLTFMDGAGYQLELKRNKSVKTDIPKSFKLAQRPTSEKNVVVETGFVGDKKYNGKVLLNLRNGNMYIQ